MPRLRYCAGMITFFLAVAPGCSRVSVTRVFLHGDTINEEHQAVPYAVVRLGDRETISDEKGHYRFLYLKSCLRGYVGTNGVQAERVEAFMKGYKPFEITVDLESIEMVGFASCPKDTDKYLKLTFIKE